MSDATIKIINVSKKYRINPGGLGDAINLVGRRLNPHNWNKDFSQDIDDKREIWALKDASFEVNKGEVLGIIGPNGAGKSTILKIISGITKPTKGKVQLNGRVGALIEVGAGFHNELTGRENVYMNGSILGMKKKEIRDNFNNIVNFAGLNKFIDTPLKKYSSGMRVRLGFSIAIHLKPEILLIDEVLSVGDISFQEKSINKMREIAESDCSIIFISHSMAAIAGFCSSAIYIKDGQISPKGTPKEVIEQYYEDLESKSDVGNIKESELSGSKISERFKLVNVMLCDQNSENKTKYRCNDDLSIAIHCYASQLIKPYFYVNVEDATHGVIFYASMLCDGKNMELCGDSIVKCTFKSISLMPGNYKVNMFVVDESGIIALMPYRTVAEFSVISLLDEYGLNAKLMHFAPKSHKSAVFQPYVWNKGSKLGTVVYCKGNEA